MKFRNLRRPARADKAGITVTPPAKKKKEESGESINSSPSDMAVYNKHVNHITKSYSSNKWSLASMHQLLQETSAERRRWIINDCPCVKEVLLKFPCLAEPKLVCFRSACTCMYSNLCNIPIYVAIEGLLLHERLRRGGNSG